MISANPLSLLLGAILVGFSMAIPAPSVLFPNCNHDNCLRQFIQSTSLVSKFCSTYTTASVAGALPTFVSQCAGEVELISSACSCIVTVTSIFSSASTSSVVSKTSTTDPTAVLLTHMTNTNHSLVSATFGSQCSPCFTPFTVPTIPASATSVPSFTIIDVGQTMKSSGPGKAQGTPEASTTSQNSPTSFMPTTATSSGPSPIHSKSGATDRSEVPDCNFEGLNSTLILEFSVATLPATNQLACQSACVSLFNSTNNGITAPIPCLSYSFEFPADSGAVNCQLYGVPFTGEVDGDDLVVKHVGSNIWYSNRFPADGSGFCYYD